MALWPADAPVAAELAGRGLRVRLDPSVREPGSLRVSDAALAAGEAREVRAPNGSSVVRVGPPEAPPLGPLPAGLLVCRAGEGSAFHEGRAGMLYRDLVPGRLGGRVIASHIRIPEGGPVPDYTHFHEVAFQVIFCHRGWVEVAYEGEGDALRMESGDLVLQAPRIRHRVLACSPGLEVVEVTSPAFHMTRTDPNLLLPGDLERPPRSFGGQRFLHHRAGDAAFEPSEGSGFLALETGVAEASAGAGSVRRLRPRGSGGATSGRWGMRAAGEAHLLFVRAGTVSLALDGEQQPPLHEGDLVRLPPGRAVEWSEPSAELELLEVRLPA